jgi:hypothetical protein
MKEHEKGKTSGKHIGEERSVKVLWLENTGVLISP